MISSQVARAESAVAEGREKVAVGGVEVGCSASLDGEVVVEAWLRQFTLQWDHYRILHSGPLGPGCCNGENQDF